MQLGPVYTDTVSFVNGYAFRLHGDDGKLHRFENAVKSGAFSKQYGNEGNRVVF